MLQGDSRTGHGSQEHTKSNWQWLCCKNVRSSREKQKSLETGKVELGNYLGYSTIRATYDLGRL